MNKSSSRLKKLLPLAITFVLIAGGGMWFLKTGDEVISTADRQTPAIGKRQAPNPKFPTAKDVIGASVSQRAFADYGLSNNTTEDDLKIIDGLIRNFYLIAKDQSNRFPMGTNREITRVLAGHNPMKRAWISADHPAIGDGGELNDRWDTPLHFHALARSIFEIRSAGPDREIFTEDDIVQGKNRVAKQILKAVSEGDTTESPEEI